MKEGRGCSGSSLCVEVVIPGCLTLDYFQIISPVRGEFGLVQLRLDSVRSLYVLVLKTFRFQCRAFLRDLGLGRGCVSLECSPFLGWLS